MDTFRLTLRAVLATDWNLHGAEDSPAAPSAYDIYLEPLAALLRTGADESLIVAWLHEREQDVSCFPSLGVQRLHRVAQKILAVTDTLPAETK